MNKSASLARHTFLRISLQLQHGTIMHFQELMFYLKGFFAADVLIPFVFVFFAQIHTFACIRVDYKLCFLDHLYNRILDVSEF